MSPAAARRSHRSFAANIARYRAGELTPNQFRPLRLGMGLYAQLPHVKHMLRIKIPGGVHAPRISSTRSPR